MAFILKQIEFRVRNETFDAKKTFKKDGIHDRFSKFDTDPEPEFYGRERVVKTRNLLTNISYRRYKPEDAAKTNFVNVFSFLTQNLNPTGLDRKI